MLANIPSYMIFDDHEVTDDWNMTRDTCKSLYGHPLGLRVAQNALVAYSLCQHWGNVPEVFEGTGPGKALLDLLNGTDAARYETNSPALRKLVAVHEESVLATQPDNAVFHDPDSLIFNFTVEGPGHQVIFTDSRSWRSFPTGRVGGGVLLPSGATGTADRRHAAGRRALRDRGDDHQRAGRGAAPLRRPARLHHQPRPALPGCLRGVGAAVDPFRSPDGEPERQAAAGRRATNRGAGAGLGRRAFQLRDAAALQGQHARRGHAAPAGQGGDRAVGRELVPQGDRQHTRIPSQRLRLRAALVLMARGPQDDARRAIVPQGYVGWSNSLGSEKAVGQHGLVVGDTFVPLYTAKLDQPTLQTSDVELFATFGGLSFGTAIDPQTPPDYSYRLDYLTPPEVSVPVDTTPIPPLPAGSTPDQRKMAAEALRLAATKYRMYNAGGKINKVIGTNNFCEITFDWHPTNVSLRRLHHTVRWRKDKDSDVELSDYVVSLDPDDTNFAELVPRAMT